MSNASRPFAMPVTFKQIARHALDGLDRSVRMAIVATMSGMVAVVSTQVLLRYGFNDSLDWGEDVARMLFVWSIFLAVPLGVKSGAHIGIELLVRAMPPGVQRWLARLIGALSVLLMATVCYRAGLLVLEQWDENLPTLDVPVALFMIPICVGAGHSVLHLLKQVVTGLVPKPAGSTE